MNLNMACKIIPYRELERRRKSRDIRLMADADSAALTWYCFLLVRQARERGVSYAEIADGSGVKRPAISHLMNFGAGVGTETAAKLARYFGKAPGDLWNEATAWWVSGGRELVSQWEAELAAQRSVS